MEPTKENVKRISPKLENNAEWHEYVDWFWPRAELRKYYGPIAMGFEMGSRHGKE